MGDDSPLRLHVPGPEATQRGLALFDPVTQRIIECEHRFTTLLGISKLEVPIELSQLKLLTSISDPVSTTITVTSFGTSVRLTRIPRIDGHHELWLVQQMAPASSIAFVDETESIGSGIAKFEVVTQRRAKRRKAWQEKVTTMRNFCAQGKRPVSALLDLKFRPAPSPYVYAKRYRETNE